MRHPLQPRHHYSADPGPDARFQLFRHPVHVHLQENFNTPRRHRLLDDPRKLFHGICPGLRGNELHQVQHQHIGAVVQSLFHRILKRRDQKPGTPLRVLSTLTPLKDRIFHYASLR